MNRRLRGQTNLGLPTNWFCSARAQNFPPGFRQSQRRNHPPCCEKEQQRLCQNLDNRLFYRQRKPNGQLALFSLSLICCNILSLLVHTFLSLARHSNKHNNNNNQKNKTKQGGVIEGEKKWRKGRLWVGDGGGWGGGRGVRREEASGQEMSPRKINLPEHLRASRTHLLGVSVCVCVFVCAGEQCCLGAFWYHVSTSWEKNSTISWSQGPVYLSEWAGA